MNYIREINAFYDWLETNTISDSAIALWHALMHINNKAGWITEFAVALSTLQMKTGLKKDAVLRARNSLQVAGRIKFKSRSGQQPAIYTMVQFEGTNNNCVVLNDTNCDTNRNTNRELTATQTTTQTASINKLNVNETKQKNNICPIEVEAFFKECCKLYPNNRGQTSDTKKKEIYKLGEIFKQCISLYLADVKAEREHGFPGKQYKNRSTFFNSGYLDYLDKATEKAQSKPDKPRAGMLVYYEDDYEPKTEEDTEIPF